MRTTDTAEIGRRLDGLTKRWSAPVADITSDDPAERLMARAGRRRDAMLSRGFKVVIVCIGSVAFLAALSAAASHFGG